MDYLKNLEQKEEIDDLELLRNRLLQRAKKFFKIKIPVKWLIFGIILRKMYEWVTITDCEHIANRLGIQNFKSVLWFLSSVTGMLLYQPKIESKLKEVVICNPQLVFSNVKEWVIEKLKCGQGTTYAFNDYGEIEIDLHKDEEKLQSRTREPKIEQCIPDRQLFEFLEYRNIIARKSKAGSKIKYVMPAMLDCHPFTDSDRLKKDQCPCPLIIMFSFGEKNQYAPKGFFSCILAKLIEKFSPDEEHIKKNYVKFVYKHENIIVVRANAKYYEVLVIEQEDENNAAELCENLKKLLKEEIIKPILKNLYFGIECPEFYVKCASNECNGDYSKEKYFNVNGSKKLCVNCNQPLSLQQKYWFQVQHYSI